MLCDLFLIMKLLSVKVAQVSLGCVLSCSVGMLAGKGSNGLEGEQNYGLGVL